MKKYIFGIGSGRCGTTSLSSILNNQDNANVSHELSGRLQLPWEVDERMFDIYFKSIVNRSDQIVGDVSFYLINYIPKLIERLPDCKIVILQRDKNQTIDSMLRKTVGLNHWVTNPRRFSTFDKCFPKFDEHHSKAERISSYYDLYYNLTSEIQHDKIFYLKTEDLNNDSKMAELFNFCEIKNPKYVKRHLNRS
jgi:hypothetical protein